MTVVFASGSSDKYALKASVQTWQRIHTLCSMKSPLDGDEDSDSTPTTEEGV